MTPDERTGTPLPDTMDTDAFAHACGVKPETVRRWVRRGLLQPHGRTLGGHMRFRADQVADALGASQPSERALDLEAHVLAAREKARARRDAM